MLGECRTLGGCDVGQAKITKGYRLPAKFVIHTVGPVWRGGTAGEPEQLASCYLNSLQLAVVQGVKTLAFPAISTGVYGYPVKKAAAVAVRAITGFLETDKTIREVLLVAFSQKDEQVLRKALAAVIPIR